MPDHQTIEEARERLVKWVELALTVRGQGVPLDGCLVAGVGLGNAVLDLEHAVRRETMEMMIARAREVADANNTRPSSGAVPQGRER